MNDTTEDEMVYLLESTVRRTLSEFRKTHPVTDEQVLAALQMIVSSIRAWTANKADRMED
jgi:hypothetical protein